MPAASVATGAAERVIVPRRPARRRALRRYGVVALFLAPWIIGFLAFIVYPMFASLYYSFTNYDLLSAPQVRRPGELHVHVHEGPAVLAGDAQHAVDHRGRAPPRDRVRDADRDAAHAAAPGAPRVPDRLLPADARAGRRGGARVRVHPQPVVRAREPDPEGARRRSPAALVLRPLDLEVGPRVPRPVGRGADDDHLPRGPPRRPGAPVRGRRDRGREPAAEVPVRDAADDVAGRSSSRS